MRVKAVRTARVGIGDDLVAVLAGALPALPDGAVVAVTSKIVSYAQGRVVPIPDAEALARWIHSEADGAVFETPYAKLTVKDGVIIANAGIDLSNAPPGHAVLWPKEPWRWAADFRARLQARFGGPRLGVVVTDSHCTPLRRGVSGVAIAFAGFEGIVSERGRADLYGRSLQFTERAVADGLAAAAVMVMGEADESTPFALIEGAPVAFTDRPIRPGEPSIAPEIDLFAPLFGPALRAAAGRQAPR